MATLLHQAVQHQPFHREVCEVLLDNTELLGATDARGRQPLPCASDNDDNALKMLQLKNTMGSFCPRSFAAQESTASNCFQNARVPGTAFSNLYWVNKSYPNAPDPFYGNTLNTSRENKANRFFVDINETGRNHYTLLYVLDIPASSISSSAAEQQQQQQWIEFRGINYEADVYINDQIAHPFRNEGAGQLSEPSVVGMFHRRLFLLPPSSGANNNRIKVVVKPPRHMGNPNTCTDCQGGAHEMALDGATQTMTAGWDWIRPVPDRNTGIWDYVTIFSTPVVVGGGSTIATTRASTSSTTNLQAEATTTKTVVIRMANAFVDTDAVTTSDEMTGKTGTDGTGGNSASLTARVFVIADIMSQSHADHADAAAPPAAVAAVVSGSLRVDIIGPEPSTDVVLTKTVDVSVSAGDQEEVKVTMPQLTDAQLWWPRTEGDQPLYKAIFTFTPTTTTSSKLKQQCSSSTATSDTTTDQVLCSNTNQNKAAVVVQDQDQDVEMSLLFGVRRFTNEVNPITKSRQFLVNGRRVFILGGNWVTTDMFMRFQGDGGERYTHEVRMHAEMGLNLIRVWGGGVSERPEFYEACDRLGMMVWQEFWMSGDNNGRWAGSYDAPLNHTAWMYNVVDTILMLRRHTSLLMWVGGNELWPLNQTINGVPTISNPPLDIQVGYLHTLAKYDPHRFYIASSMTSFTDFDVENSMAPADGPYGPLTPPGWFERNPTFTEAVNRTGTLFGFNPEMGTYKQLPMLRSLKRFMPPETLEYENLPNSYPNNPTPGDPASEYTNMTCPFPTWIESKNKINMWWYHLYGGNCDGAKADNVKAFGSLDPSDYSPALRKQTTAIAEYVWRGQIYFYSMNKFMYEGFVNHVWSWYTGMIIWKSQGPWPSLRGHLYDYYLDQSSAFFGIRDALVTYQSQEQQPSGSATSASTMPPALGSGPTIIYDWLTGTLTLVNRGVTAFVNNKGNHREEKNHDIHIESSKHVSHQHQHHLPRHHHGQRMNKNNNNNNKNQIESTTMTSTTTTSSTTTSYHLRIAFYDFVTGLLQSSSATTISAPDLPSGTALNDVYTLRDAWPSAVPHTHMLLCDLQYYSNSSSSSTSGSPASITTLAKNRYWMQYPSPNATVAELTNMTLLNQELRQKPETWVQLDVSVTETVVERRSQQAQSAAGDDEATDADEHVFKATVSHPAKEGESAPIAFFAHLQLHQRKNEKADKEASSASSNAGDEDDDRVLPTHYSRNFLVLLPGESVVVTMAVPQPQPSSASTSHDDAKSKSSKSTTAASYYVSIEGWNIVPATVDVSMAAEQLM